MVDVSVDVVVGERFDTDEHGYALAQLGHGGAGQAVSQLGLSGQDDLHQFHPGSFEIGKQPDRFEDFFIEILRFVYNEHETTACAHLVGEQPVQAVVHGRQIHSGDVNAQVDEQVTNELARVAIGAKDEGGAGLIAKVGKVVVEQGSLAHSRIGRASCRER